MRLVRVAQGFGNLFVHRLEGTVLPVEDFLAGRRRRIPFRIHGNTDVNFKVFVLFNFADDFLRYFSGNNMLTLGGFVPVPREGGPEEVLIFKAILIIINHYSDILYNTLCYILCDCITVHSNKVTGPTKTTANKCFFAMRI